MMAKLIDWINDERAGEAVLGVVFGDMGWDEDYAAEHIPNYRAMLKGVVLSLADAMPWLDYEFYDGFGGVNCQSVYIWTTTKVIFIHEYDGSTTIQSVPRNPTACMPEMR
jgi:hypothetical protein